MFDESTGLYYLNARYTYDAKGNQITEKVGNNAITANTYDVENRLTSVSKQGKQINRNMYNSARHSLICT